MMWIEELPSHWWLDLGAVELFILGLATWRLASMVVNEDGPFYLFERFRYFLGVRYDEFNEKIGLNLIAEMLTCLWCASVWVSLLVVLLYLNFPIPTFIVSLILSVSSITILIEKVLDCD